MNWIIAKGLLIPFLGMAEGEHSNLGTIMFMMGFVLMMILDVALG